MHKDPSCPLKDAVNANADAGYNQRYGPNTSYYLELHCFYSDFIPYVPPPLI